MNVFRLQAEVRVFVSISWFPILACSKSSCTFTCSLLAQEIQLFSAKIVFYNLRLVLGGFANVGNFLKINLSYLHAETISLILKHHLKNCLKTKTKFKSWSSNTKLSFPLLVQPTIIILSQSSILIFRHLVADFGVHEWMWMGVPVALVPAPRVEVKRAHCVPYTTPLIVHRARYGTTIVILDQNIVCWMLCHHFEFW